MTPAASAAATDITFAAAAAAPNSAVEAETTNQTHLSLSLSSYPGRRNNLPHDESSLPPPSPHLLSPPIFFLPLPALPPVFPL